MRTSAKTPKPTIVERMAEDLRLSHNLRHFDLEEGCRGWTLALEAVRTLPATTLARIIASDPVPDDCILPNPVVGKWLGEAQSSYELLTRLAAAVIASQVERVCHDLPTFNHNCRQCAYLGVMRLTPSKRVEADANPHNIVDLYVCDLHANQTLLVVRYGDELEQHYSSSDYKEWSNDPHLAEASDRTYRRGRM